MSDKLRGTGVALATPMNEDKSVDFQGFEKLVNHVVSGGVDYVVLMGTTGESPTIEADEKRELLSILIKLFDGKVPLVYGLGGNSTQEVIRELQALKGLSIDAILSASPNYNKPSQEGIYQHYKALADQSEFPILLYNVPHRTSSNIKAETTLRLAVHPNIIGIKEATSDLIQCGIIARDKPSGFLLICGDDFLTLPMLSIGGEGVISVAANAYPSLINKLVNAGLNRDFVTARNLHLEYLERYQLIVSEGNPSSIKAALESMNICQRFVRLPLISASDELVRTFGKFNK
jgi:4-hydroxy-tetrahydrodipicolinate synthase